MTGNAHFLVEYSSVVFKPYRNEILPTEVTLITEQGIECTAGPLTIHVAIVSIPSFYQYNATDKQFVSQDGEKLIKMGSRCRVKILGMTVHGDDIKAVGTMRGSYLGTDM
mmetsp:Transcript_4855/g.7206  ORF Transcript_4855/g.7206 Transcript_4855/m.7206 type:complete len:110 (+) Transcript_4855:943-1272(+)